MLASPDFARWRHLRAIWFCVSPSSDFVLGYRLREISHLSITFMRFMIKKLRLLVGMKSITLAFNCWDDGASFDELTVICLSVYLVAFV
jgi:hypothetical protein